MNSTNHLAATRFENSLRTAALIGLAILAPAAALAGSPAEAAPTTRSTHVSLAGLDLSTPEGAKAARERLYRTASQLCAQVAVHADYWHQADVVACIEDTMTAAIRHLSTAALAAAKSGPVTPVQAAAAPARPVTVSGNSRSTQVSLSDLDLSTAAGARVARERLEKTARELCTGVVDQVDYWHQTQYIACVDQTLADALRQASPAAMVARATRAGAKTAGSR